MIGMVDLSGKGSKIHGIVEEYVAKGDISTGGFVKLINEKYGYICGTNTELSNANNSGKNMLAIALDVNRVLVLYNKDSYLYGMICNVTDKNITIEKDKCIDNNPDSGVYFSAVLLEENKVFVTYKYVAGERNFINATILTITDTIQTGTNEQIDSAILDNVCLTKLNSNKVLIAYTLNFSLYGIVCTINGTTITVGTRTKMADADKIWQIVTISETMVLALYKGKDNAYLCGATCTISGTSIAPQNYAILSALGSVSQAVYVVLINSNTVFIAYSSGTNNYLYGLICNIAGTTMTVNTETQLSIQKHSAEAISVVKNGENKIIVVHSNGVEIHLCATAIEIDSNTIIVRNTEILSTIEGSAYAVFAVAIGADIFIVHNSNTDTYKLHGLVVEPILITEAQAATQQDKIYRHSPKQSTRRTSRQGHKTKLYYRGGKLK